MELITSTQLYWFTRLNVINGLALAMLVFGFIVSVISGFVTLVTTHDFEERDHAVAKTIFRWTFSMFIIGLLTRCFVPNTREAAAIWAIPKVVNNPQVQSIGTNTLNIADIGIKYLREVIEEKKNEVGK